MSAAEKAITLVMFQLIWALHWCWLFSVILTTDLFQTCKAKGFYFTHEQCSCIFYVSACLLLLECPEEYMKTGHSSQTRVLLLQYYVWKDLWPTKPIHCGVVLVLHIALCLESQVLLCVSPLKFWSVSWSWLWRRTNNLDAVTSKLFVCLDHSPCNWLQGLKGKCLHMTVTKCTLVWERICVWSCSSDCLTVTVSLSLQRQPRISDRSFQG